MSDSTSLHRIRSIVLHLFPWMARIGIASSGALAVRGAANRTELEGGGPAVLRVGDVGRIAFDPGIPATTPPALYYSPDMSSAFTPVVMLPAGSTAGGTVPSLPGGTPSTQIAPKGSTKVSAG